MDKQKCLGKTQDTIKTIPKAHQNLLTQVYQGKISMKKAIKAKCLDCVGYENAIDRIKECKVYACPLLRVRPYKTEIEILDKPKTNRNNDGSALREWRKSRQIGQDG